MNLILHFDNEFLTYLDLLIELTENSVNFECLNFLFLMKVDRTFDALEKDSRRGSRRISAVLRTQKDEDEERQKILMDMNARSHEKGIAH